MSQTEVQLIKSSSVVDGDIVGMSSSKLSGALPAISGASLTNLPGGGITQADIYRFNTTANLSYDTVTVVDSNWERPDESNDVFDKIGTGMSESSGIFTFPATGIYLVQWIVRFAGSSSSNANHIYIDATTNNSTYVTVAQSAVMMNSNGQMTAIAQSFLDISDTTNRKVRFKVYAAASNQQVLGNSSKQETYATFIRLADT